VVEHVVQQPQGGEAEKCQAGRREPARDAARRQECEDGDQQWRHDGDRTGEAAVAAPQLEARVRHRDGDAHRGDGDAGPGAPLWQEERG
jgi:hypothetical protein